MAFSVVLLENAPAHLTGAVSRWLHHVGPGLLIGHLSARVRQELWGEVVAGVEDGRALLAWSAPNGQGFEIETCGTGRYRIVDLDGLVLMGIDTPVVTKR